MAPIEKTDHDLVEQQIKDTIQSLFQLLVQVSTYDQAGRATQPILSSELSTLSSSLRAVHRTASSSLPPSLSNPNPNPSSTTTTTTTTSLPSIPDTLIEYVENGRNPDVYTREMVELVRRMNQLARGKEMAFVKFRDVLAREMAGAMPELRGDVERVIRATGGEVPIAPVTKEEEGTAGGNGVVGGDGRTEGNGNGNRNGGGGVGREAGK
ncbi:hypothetical protein NKR19_g5561 [Coniochaeta hoffmannii]|uniref:Mediator of RNA polymerase II transcription subunit 10 n=1 Tax=Coniochaeta hoffmannii TaxID=91930 RepID=A0AA38RJ74_9PEZI|nr:hypothetical protein NKR19_g5561 [Coniochaeta hoffmannii]